LLLNIAPGPDTLYIVGRSSTAGMRAGALAALGIGTGALVHVCAAALGLSAILAASAGAFTAVKIIGAAYLVYVGVSLIGSKSSTQSPPVASGRRPASMRGIFFQGFLTNVLNPSALFFGVSAAIRFV
jgi:threonine/homoserine/homoserine lactone efflux protein